MFQIWGWYLFSQSCKLPLIGQRLIMCHSPLSFSVALFTKRVLRSLPLFIMVYLMVSSAGFWPCTLHIISPWTDAGRTHFSSIFWKGYHFAAVDRFLFSESKIHTASWGRIELFLKCLRLDSDNPYHFQIKNCLVQGFLPSGEF